MKYLITPSSQKNAPEWIAFLTCDQRHCCAKQQQGQSIMVNPTHGINLMSSV